MDTNANLDLTVEPASTFLEGPKGKIPLIVAAHDRTTGRLHYYRTRSDVASKFRPAARDTAPDGMNIEELVNHLAMGAFDAGHSLVAIGRAEPGESFGDAMSAIEKFEARISKR